ncbi:hypothetical protein H6P81_013344 [Aristolochia fimbriata]|uniref:4-coumarate--CoA ligase n=1 Tax=Aristolochia fimbriata TaxID=158543 RepID=A0AAV7EFM9_ARIFI|nr:hypothetical protein H6P81_013344 [Aristolochia fimbriata]
MADIHADVEWSRLLPRIDAKSGYCPETKIFHSLRPPFSLPPPEIPLSAAAYLRSLLGSSPDAAASTALVDARTGFRISYAELLDRSDRLATSLICEGLVLPGGLCVAFVLAPNSLHLPLLYLALLSLDVAVSPANPLGTPADVSRQFRLTKPAIAFATSDTAHKLPPTNRLRVVLLDSPEFDAMTSGPTSLIPPQVVRQSSPAAILYSSGTTGKVKGVVLSHRNLIAAVAFARSICRDQAEPAGVYLVAVPMFHVYGFMRWLGMAAVGETAVVMDKFELGRALKAVEEFKVTHFPVAPPVVVAMTKEGASTEKYDLCSLREVWSGGAPLPVATAHRFTAKFPRVLLVQGFGLTESAECVSQTLGEEESRRSGSAGRLSPNMEAKIVDPVTGDALPPGRTGELWLRGPALMKGYVGDDAAAATAMSIDGEGWLRTGDLCYIDEDGFLFVVDRLKEVIKYKGYQVPPAELEHLLQTHPEIVDAAVIPYPDEEAGQIPMAFVVTTPQSRLDPARVMDFVAPQVAPFKKIRRVAFVNSIPKNPTGKILRRELRKLAISGTSTTTASKL